MKKLVVMLVLAAFIAGCSPSDEGKAKKLIQEYLKEGLNNPKSYESISFSALDSVFTDVYFDKMYLALDDSVNMYKMRAELKMDLVETARIYRFFDDARAHLAEAEILLDKMRYFSEKRIDYIRGFVSEFSGWKMKHEFRATNAMNALIKSTYVFNFNKDVTEIKNVEQLD